MTLFPRSAAACSLCPGTARVTGLQDSGSARESEAKPEGIQGPTFLEALRLRSLGRKGLASHFTCSPFHSPRAGSLTWVVWKEGAVLDLQLEGQVTWDR